MAKSTQTSSNNDAPGDSPMPAKRSAGMDPVILAAGAAIAGAVAGALLPRSPAETRLLAPVGKHVKEAAKSLGTVARQALSAELAGVPVVGEIAAEQIDRVIESVVPSAVEAEPDTADRDAEETGQPALAD